MPTRFYYGARTAVRPAVRLLWNPKVSGLDNVPRRGGFLVASNHLANIDSFVLPVVFPRAVRFVAKDTLWTRPGISGRILRWFFDAVGAVPVDRQGIASGKGALQAALGVIEAGSGFGIYPEGSRSKDGLLHAGKQGAAWLALESGCPVVPVGLVGTPELISRRLPRRGAVSIRVGTPIDPAEIDPTLPTGVRRRLLTERIMDEIQQLSGQQRASDPRAS